MTYNEIVDLVADELEKEVRRNSRTALTQLDVLKRIESNETVYSFMDNLKADVTIEISRRVSMAEAQRRDFWKNG